MGKRLHDTVIALDLALMVVSDTTQSSGGGRAQQQAVVCPLRLQASTVASVPIQGGTRDGSQAAVNTQTQDSELRRKNKDKKNKDEKNKSEKNKGEKNRQWTALLHYPVELSWRRGTAVRGRARGCGSPTTIAERECRMQTALETLSRVGSMTLYALDNISNVVPLFLVSTSALYAWVLPSIMARSLVVCATTPARRVSVRQGHTSS